MRRLICLLASVIVTGCASFSAIPDGRSASAQRHHDISTSVRNASDSDILTLLYGQYDQWQGVPYRYGGQSKQGVDCSGLVQTTYRDLFGVDLPRTTRYQIEEGDYVKREHLLPGDLVFFRVGPHGRHVGIYLENNQFMHASASGGVVISDLNDPYWRRYYWQAKRISAE